MKLYIKIFCSRDILLPPRIHHNFTTTKSKYDKTNPFIPIVIYSSGIYLLEEINRSLSHNSLIIRMLCLRMTFEPAYFNNGDHCRKALEFL